jgi:hypothetical protein
MTLRQMLVGVSALVVAVSANALDQQKFDAAKALYEKRSYLTDEGRQSALNAAQAFEAVLPTATNSLEQALVLNWVAQSYFTHGDALAATEPEVLTEEDARRAKEETNEDLLGKQKLNKAQREAKLTSFNLALAFSRDALAILGIAKPAAQPGESDSARWDNDPIFKMSESAWQSYGASLTTQTRPLAEQALYFLAASYSQKNSLERDLGLVPNIVDQVSRFDRMYRIGDALKHMGGEAYYRSGSARITGRILDQGGKITALRAALIAYGYLPTIWNQAPVRLGQALTKTAIQGLDLRDPRGRPLPLSDYGFNNLFLIDAHYYSGDAARKAAALTLLNAFVTVPLERFAPETLPETVMSLERAKARLAVWK